MSMMYNNIRISLKRCIDGHNANWKRYKTVQIIDMTLIKCASQILLEVREVSSK
jgi:hypothetical protein